jgi:diazepam-binding inhibitor (GABA receptor modulating acyl-CoA-binding protein)
MNIEENFKYACENVQSLETKPSNSDLLYLYSHFKQATVGDCNTEQPSFFDAKNRSKWNAWKELEGMTKNDAMLNYCGKFLELSE